MLPVGLHELWPNVRLHVFEADESGPTVLVQAGIHGDEVAGVHALEELLEAGLRPARGRLLVIPVMNPPAYRARERAAPGPGDALGLDLNRCFPGRADGAREERLAKVFMDLVMAERPAVMATLHESWKRHHPDFPVSFGQTVTYGVEPRPPIVDSLCKRMNEALENAYERWAPHFYPVATSSTEVIVEALQRVGVDPVAGLCIETWMGFALSRRVAMQKRMVRLILDEAGVLPFPDVPMGGRPPVRMETPMGTSVVSLGPATACAVASGASSGAPPAPAPALRVPSLPFPPG